jgi:WD40 repeat protein
MWKFEQPPKDARLEEVEWESLFSLQQQKEKAHSEAINYLTVLNVQNKNEEVYFATMSLDGTLKMWKLAGESFA